jgi:hypothetical protein
MKKQYKNHAQKRFQKRFGHNLSESDLTTIKSKIIAGDYKTCKFERYDQAGHTIQRISLSLGAWRAICIWNYNLKKIITIWQDKKEVKKLQQASKKYNGLKKR